MSNQVMGVRMGVEPHDGGLNNMAFMGELQNGRFPEAFQIKWLDWENNVQVQPPNRPSRKLLNKAFTSMCGGIGGVASATKLGSALALELRTYAGPCWNSMSDANIYGTGDMVPWLTQFFGDLRGYLTSKLASMEAVLANPALVLSSLSSLPVRDPSQAMNTANPAYAQPTAPTCVPWMPDKPTVKPAQAIPALSLPIRLKADPWSSGAAMVTLPSQPVHERPLTNNTALAPKIDPWMPEATASPPTGKGDKPADKLVRGGLNADGEGAPNAEGSTCGSAESAPPLSQAVFPPSDIASSSHGGGHVESRGGSVPTGFPPHVWAAMADAISAPPRSPCNTPRDDMSVRQVRVMRESYGESSRRGTQKRKGKATDSPQHCDFPQWVGDVVAMFLASFHRAVQPYALDRAWKDAKQADYSYDHPRTIRQTSRFVQQRHKGATQAFQRKAGAADRNENSWVLESRWIDIALAREVAADMLAPFFWMRHETECPRGTWGWKSFWLSDYEVSTILTQTMGGFLSATRRRLSRRRGFGSMMILRRVASRWCVT